MFRKLLLAFVICFMQLTWVVPCVDAALKLPDKSKYDTLIQDNKVANSGEKKTMQAYVEAIFTEANIKVANVVLAGIAFVYLVVLGAKMLFNQGDSERISSLRTQFIYILVGLIVISAAYFIGFEIFNVGETSLDKSDKPLENFNQFIGLDGGGIIDYLRIIIASVALGMILISGYQLIGSATDEETIQNEKGFIRSFLVAIVLVLLSEVIIRLLSGDNFKDGNDTTVTEDIAQQGIEEIIGLVNYVLTFITGIAFFMIVLAGLYYVISFGDEERAEKAKKIIIANIVAGVIAFSSLVVIRIFING